MINLDIAFSDIKLRWDALWPEPQPPIPPLERSDMIALRERVIKCAAAMDKELSPIMIDCVAEELGDIALELVSRSHVEEQS